jgi:hypothetical protein
MNANTNLAQSVGVIIPSPSTGLLRIPLKITGTPSSILPRQGEGGKIVVIGDSAR